MPHHACAACGIIGHGPDMIEVPGWAMADYIEMMSEPVYRCKYGSTQFYHKGCSPLLPRKFLGGFALSPTAKTEYDKLVAKRDASMYRTAKKGKQTGRKVADPVWHEVDMAALGVNPEHFRACKKVAL